MSERQSTSGRPAEHMVDGPAAGQQVAEALARTWSDSPGWLGRLSAVNHKTVARRFVITTFVFFLLGGLLALAMRLQLARPGNRLVGPELYNQLFTIHARR